MLHRNKATVAVTGILVITMLVACGTRAPQKQQAVDEVIPLTMANIKGHKTLYKEGWFVVSSTEKAVEYSKEKSIVSSREVLKRLREDIKTNNVNYAAALKNGLYNGADTRRAVLEGGTDNPATIFKKRNELLAAELAFTSGTFIKGMESFWLGYAHLDQRTEADRSKLSKIPGRYYEKLRSDFTNLDELTDSLNEVITPSIKGNWAQAMEEAQTEFNESYEKSGQRKNSLTAMFDVLAGYGKAVYLGLISPLGRSSVQGVLEGAKLTNEYVFLPTTKLFVLTGRTVQSAGLSLYYTTSMGVKVVSPTVEGGLLTALAIVSSPAVPVTAIAGSTAGVVNQVAITAVAPVAGVAHSTLDMGAETIIYGAQMGFDISTGTAKVVFNQLSSGVVLGYNALTALPTQTVLATTNTVFFLAWDGPRLVIASARGEVNFAEEGNAVPIDIVPVGSIVDINALNQQEGVEVNIVSDDPAVIEKVLERSVEDMREVVR